MGVSENSGAPKSSILIGFSIINHPIWGTPVFGNTLIGWNDLPGNAPPFISIKAWAVQVLLFFRVLEGP